MLCSLPTTPGCAAIVRLRWRRMCGMVPELRSYCVGGTLAIGVGWRHGQVQVRYLPCAPPPLTAARQLIFHCAAHALRAPRHTHCRRNSHGISAERAQAREQ